VIFQVLTAESMKVTVLWDVQYSSAEVDLLQAVSAPPNDKRFIRDCTGQLLDGSRPQDSASYCTAHRHLQATHSYITLTTELTSDYF
jgi:hypothetical protein